jgi:ATP-binding cassette subfamily F protein uup
MHGGVTGRRKRNVRRVANLQALRAERRSAIAAVGNVRLTAAEGTTSGKLVIEATGISKSFGDRVIVQGFSTRIARGDCVGIIGPNGAGKTTLLAMLTGALAPDEGQVKLGTNLEMVTLDQRREALRPDWTLAEALAGGRGDQVVVNGVARHVVSYMKDFLFVAEQARTPLRVLSGGERGRLMLARALARPSNLLVLDEPTNDLDLETLDLLQEMLAEYSGTVLVVSHDRDFLDRVATSVIVAEGDGRWIEYAGGYTDMLAQRGAANEDDKTRTPAKSSTVASSPEAPPPPSQSRQRKLSYAQTQALATLPKQIAALEAEIATLGRKLSDAQLFTRDPAGFNAATTRMAAAQSELETAESAWLELEMLKEEIDASRAR